MGSKERILSAWPSLGHVHVPWPASLESLWKRGLSPVGRRIPGSLWPVVDGRSVHGPVQGIRAAFKEAGMQEFPEQSKYNWRHHQALLHW